VIVEDPHAPAPGTCPFCGMAVRGSPNQCARCGTLLGAAAEDLKAEGARERRRIRSRKASADLLFLVGLLLGGPMVTLAGRLELGAFIVLAGAASSVLRRYTESSLGGSLTIGALFAGLVAALVLEPAHQAVEESLSHEDARQAFVAALDGIDPDVLVEARGPGLVTVWFTLPQDRVGECGEYPPALVRSHLSELGFLRVVVVDRNQGGGLCSFVP